MSKKFTPALLMCGMPDCEYPLQSSYPGQFVACPIHGSYVDQTSHYTRVGGAVVVDRVAMKEAYWTMRCQDWWVGSSEDFFAARVWIEEMEELWGDADEYEDEPEEP